MEISEVEAAGIALAAANNAALAARQALVDAQAALKAAEVQIGEADKEYRRCCNDFVAAQQTPPA